MNQAIKETVKEYQRSSCQDEVKVPLFAREQEIDKGAQGRRDVKTQDLDGQKKTEYPAPYLDHPSFLFFRE